MRILKQQPQLPTTLGALFVALLKAALNLRTQAVLPIMFPILFIFTFATLLTAQEQPPAIEITDPQIPRNAVLLAQGTVDGKPALLVFDPDDVLGAPMYFVVLAWARGRVVGIRDFRYARYAIEGAELHVLDRDGGGRW